MDVFFTKCKYGFLWEYFLNVDVVSICWWYFSGSILDKVLDARLQPLLSFRFVSSSQVFANMSFLVWSYRNLILWGSLNIHFLSWWNQMCRNNSCGDVGIVTLGCFIFRMSRFCVKVDVSVCGFWKDHIDKVCWFRVMQISKKLIVLVDYDISNFMTDFIIFVSLYFWQSSNNSFSESSSSVLMKNMSSIKRSHVKGFFTVYLWNSLRRDVSNM